MNNFNNKSELLNFYYSSITDIQSTIRAIDTKLGFLFIILIFPFSNISKIFNNILYLTNNIHNVFASTVAYSLIFIFSFSWIFAFVTLIKGVLAIHNPSEHIRDFPKEAGKFYVGNLFKFSILDSFLNRKSVLSDVPFEKYFEEIKSNNDTEYLLKELVFEQHKLAYIRDIKLFRQKYSFYSTLIWLMSGFIIWAWVICKKGV